MRAAFEALLFVGRFNDVLEDNNNEDIDDAAGDGQNRIVEMIIELADDGNVEQEITVVAGAGERPAVREAPVQIGRGGQAGLGGRAGRGGRA